MGILLRTIFILENDSSFSKVTPKNRENFTKKSVTKGVTSM